jgi:hypothetical protein
VVVSGPCVAERPETGLLAGDGGENVQQVAGGSRQSVEPRHHHNVINLKLVKQPAELRAVGLGFADMHVAENLSASGLGQLPRLGVNALALSARRYPCIPVFHGVVMQLIYAAKKPFVFRDLILLRNSSWLHVGGS